MQWAKGMGIGTTGSSQATAKRQQLADMRWEIKADWNQAVGLMLAQNNRQSSTRTDTVISHLIKATNQDQSKVVKRQQITSNEGYNLTSSCSKTPTRGLQFQSFVAFMILGLESSNTAKTFKAPAHNNA